MTELDLDPVDDGVDLELIGFAELVAELAVSLADERSPGPKESLAELIVGGAAAIIPGVLSAAVETLDGQGRLEAPVTAGDAVARAVMEAQNITGQGPCLDALRDAKQVFVSDLANDTRWPLLAARVAESRVRSMVCTPMEVNGRLLGVLSVTGTGLHFDDEDLDIEALARVFAAHAGVALSGASKVSGMLRALDSRDVIGQAKGILMERFKVMPDVAFAMLVRTSANTNTKLRRVCDVLCETGVLPAAQPRKPTSRVSSTDD